jgi:hypothetical protein
MQLYIAYYFACIKYLFLHKIKRSIMKYSSVILISLLIFLEQSFAQNIDTKYNYLANKKGVNINLPNLPVLQGMQKQKNKKQLTATDKIYKPAQTIECYRDTSKITYSYDQKGNITFAFREYKSGGKWLTGNRSTYTYDENGNEIQRLDEYYSDSTWCNTYRYTCTYDGNGNMLTYTYDLWQANRWIHNSTEIYSYDNNHNVLERIHKDFINGSWRNANKYSYLYDGNGNILSFIAAEGNDNGWNLRTRQEYAYDNSGNMVLSNQDVWKNGEWSKYLRGIYTYNDAGKILTFINQDYSNGFVVTYKWINAYNGKGNIDTSLYEEWAIDSLFNARRIIYTYNSNDLLNSEISFDWADSIWINVQRNIYEYGSNSNVKTGERWVDTCWVSTEQTIDTFDINNNMLARTMKVCSYGNWRNYTMYNYNYDENNNTTKAEFLYWENNKWNSGPGYLTLVYNNYQDTISFTGNMKSMSYLQFTGVEDNIQTVEKYSISQNYPNPFNPATTINYQLPKSGVVSIKVYDILGSEIKTLVNEYKQPGSYAVKFDASKLSSGVYIYRIISGNYSASKKMILIK